MSRTILMIIDPQNDFVDPKGSLYVKGAEEVVSKIAEYIRKYGENYTDIIVTLDTHRKIHISLSNGWTHKPAPFTRVVKKVSDDFELTAQDLPLKYYGAEGVQIWPDHCIIGTWGHCIPEVLTNALAEWEVKKRKGVFYQRKGEDCGFEAYSALTKEILTGVKPKWRTWGEEQDEIDGGTTIWPRQFDICGFCKDICVAETVKDLVKHAGERNIDLLDDLCATLDPESENLKTLKKLEEGGMINITSTHEIIR